MFNFVRKYGPRSLALVALTAAAIAAAPAAAQGHGGFHGGGGGWHGGGYHGGGWGWGVGVGFYDPWWPGYYGGYPYYPYYGETPVTVIQQPMVGAQQQVQQAPAPATYYYCDEPAGYYPYVQNCGKPWRAVPAVPQGVPPQQ